MAEEEVPIEQIESLIKELKENKLPENWLWHYDKVEKLIKTVNKLKSLQIHAYVNIGPNKILFSSAIKNLYFLLEAVHKGFKQKISAEKQKRYSLEVNASCDSLVDYLFDIRLREYKKRYHTLTIWGMQTELNIELARFLVQHWDDTIKLAEKANEMLSRSQLLMFGLPALSNIINEKTWPRVLKVFYFVFKISKQKSDFVFDGLDEVKEILTAKNWIKFVKGFIAIVSVIKLDGTSGDFFQGFKYLKKIVTEDSWKEIVNNIVDIIDTDEAAASSLFVDGFRLIRAMITKQNWSKIYFAIIKAEKEFPGIFLTERVFREWCYYSLKGGTSKEDFIGMRLQKRFGNLRLNPAIQEGLAFSNLYAEDVAQIKKLIGLKIKKVFPLGKVYSGTRVHGVIELSNPVELVRVLTIVLLTPPKKGVASIQEMLKSPEYTKYLNFLRQYSKARALFDFEKLYKAREYILKSDINIRKAFMDIKFDFEMLTKDKSRFAAQRIIDYFAKIAGRGSRKASALADIVLGIKSLLQGTLKFNYVILKMQDGNISDIFDSEKLMCCAFYPDGIRKSASLNYLQDSYTGLLQLKAAIKSPFKPLKEVANISVAILMVCRDKDNKTVLMVDSVEGNNNYWGCLKEREWFNLMYKGIVQVKKDIKADYIVFNADLSTGNATPKIFNEYLARQLSRSPRVVELTKLGRGVYGELFLSKTQEGFCVE